jgi:hypothetical protein
MYAHHEYLAKARHDDLIRAAAQLLPVTEMSDEGGVQGADVGGI